MTSLSTRSPALVALTLVIGLGSAHAATPMQPDVSDAAVRGYSAAALFNEANADARQGRVGLAILNYERALLLDPGDRDIAANLRFVRAKAGLPDPPQSAYNRGVTTVRPNTMAWLGFIGLMLAGSSLLVARFSSRRRRAFRTLVVVGTVLIAAAVASAVAMFPRLKGAVILAPAASARPSPALAAAPAFTLREGETVTASAEHQGFVLVSTSDGRSAWVAAADLARVVPTAG